MQAIIKLITNPTEAFQELRDSSSWRYLFIIIILVSGTFGIFSLKYSKSIIEQRMEARKDAIIEAFDNKGMDGEAEYQKMLENATKIDKKKIIITGISSIFGIPIFYLLITLVYFLISLIIGVNSNYKGLFIILVYSNIVSLVEMIFKGILMTIKGSAQIFTSPAVLLPLEKAGTPLFKLLNGFDIFTLWKLALVAIGISVFFNETKKKGYTVSIIFWVISIIFSILLSKLTFFA